MTKHFVKSGDCLVSVAAQYGVPWKTLWEHPENSELKSLRKDPNVLSPGDVVKIPPRDGRTEPGSTNKRHRFVKKSDPARVRIRVLVDDRPRADQPFKLVIGDNEVKGYTDGDGFLESVIPPDASDGVLSVGFGSETLRFPVKFGLLDPVETDSGIQQRLVMLGFDTRAGLEESIKAFQGDHSLQETGSVDDVTREQLKKEFGQ